MTDRERLPRRLAAILYADVADYSRLTGDDEDATHRVLREYLDHISAAVDAHRGKVMHYAGDAVLAMFEAAVDALACAVAVQSELRARNECAPVARRIRFRIGVNLGDVIEDRGDIYGDGVNIAARLQSLAEPGEICISDSVHTAVGTKLDVTCHSLGEHRVKNISRPLRAYRVLDGSSTVTERVAAEGPGDAIRILVADDHALIRAALKNTLAALTERVMVLEAEDTDGALRIAGETELDLVLLDLDLPTDGGFAVLEVLRRRFPATAVVVLSGHEDREHVVGALERGASGYIPKTSSNEIMLSALRLVLSGGQYLPPQVLVGSGPDAATPSGAARSVTRPGDLGLTQRQCEVLALMMQGKSNKLICRDLGVAERTVKIHVSAVLKALNVTSRTQAVIAAERMGLNLDTPHD